MAYTGSHGIPPTEGYYMTDAFTDKATCLFPTIRITKDSGQCHPLSYILAYNASTLAVACFARGILAKYPKDGALRVSDKVSHA